MLWPLGESSTQQNMYNGSFVTYFHMLYSNFFILLRLLGQNISVYHYFCGQKSVTRLCIYVILAFKKERNRFWHQITHFLWSFQKICLVTNGLLSNYLSQVHPYNIALYFEVFIFSFFSLICLFFCGNDHVHGDVVNNLAKKSHSLS